MADMRARPITLSRRRPRPSQALQVTARRSGTSTMLRLRGSLGWSELPLLDEMTDWLLIWSDRQLVIDIDDLTGSDTLFATWLRHRQRRRLLAGDQIFAHTSNPQRRSQLITAGLSCDAHPHSASPRGASPHRASPRGADRAGQPATTSDPGNQTTGRAQRSGPDRHRRSPTGPSWGP